MNRYRTRVSTRRVAAGVVAIVLAIAGLLALTHWLVPSSDVAAVSPAPAPATGDPAPGAVTCPTSASLPTRLAPTASELVDCPDLYEGRRVTYRGEAIEAVFPLGDRAVVVLNDDDYALGPGPLPEARTALGGNSGLAVVLPAGTAADVRVLGDYRHRGDLLEVVGVYRSASDLLGGEPAIVADHATVVQPGRAIDHGVDLRTALAALTAAVMAASMGVAELRSRR